MTEPRLRATIGVLAGGAAYRIFLWLLPFGLIVGGALGLAVLASLAAWKTGGETAATSLNAGYQLAFVVGGVELVPVPATSARAGVIGRVAVEQGSRAVIPREHHPPVPPLDLHPGEPLGGRHKPVGQPSPLPSR